MKAIFLGTFLLIQIIQNLARNKNSSSLRQDKFMSVFTVVKGGLKKLKQKSRKFYLTWRAPHTQGGQVETRELLLDFFGYSRVLFCVTIPDNSAQEKGVQRHSN